MDMAWLVFPQSKHLLIAMLALASALPLFAQALLHVFNLPTLVMLLTLLILVGCAAGQPGRRPFAQACALVILLSVLFLLLFDEYRLSVNALLFALFASILFAFAKSLLSQAPSVTLPANIAWYRALLWPSVIRLTLSLALVITLVWALIIEDTLAAFTALGRINPGLLILNLVSVIAVCVSGSTVAAIEHQSSTSESVDIAISLLFFAGHISFWSVIFLRPSFLTILQVTAFVAGFPLLATVSWYETRTGGGSVPPISANALEGGHGLVIQPAIGGPFNGPSLNPPRRTFVASWRGKMTLATCSVILWILFAFLNHSTFRVPIGVRREPVLDHGYHSTIDLDIIVSMYQEDTASIAATLSHLQALPEFAKRSTRVIVYCKDGAADLSALRQGLGATEIIERPNIGREGETYLHHIITKFDDLATHTLFIQAHTHNPTELYRRINGYFTSATGMLSLGFSGYTCDCNHCSDRWGWEDERDIIPQLYQQVYNRTCSSVLLSYKGQFIASARRIRGIDRKIYESLQSLLVTSNSWAHTEPFLRGRPDSLSAPLYGFSLERAWSILMQCAEQDIAFKCPTLLSGTRRGGRLDDCQCLDGLD